MNNKKYIEIEYNDTAAENLVAISRLMEDFKKAQEEINEYKTDYDWLYMKYDKVLSKLADIEKYLDENIESVSEDVKNHFNNIYSILEKLDVEEIIKKIRRV